ncbi:MAG: MBL fold metallo-hydrolase [Methanosarcinaceae archaeon]|nr:MBL fold metallo-hydrolase [Methanosarcinaceae archaeon]
MDAGLSGKKIKEGLHKIGVDGHKLDAILVTHEHKDHIQGVGVLSRQYDLPIYANELTWTAMEHKLGKIKEENYNIFDGDFTLGNLEIQPFSIPHDASDPVGYVIYGDKTKIGIATDMGYIPNKVKDILKETDLLVIEANHDMEMLMSGPYPWMLKNRIKGELGHLSNDTVANILPELINGNFSKILLAHLSKNNNMPKLAYETIKGVLENNGLYVGKDIQLDLTYQDKPTNIYEV